MRSAGKTLLARRIVFSGGLLLALAVNALRAADVLPKNTIIPNQRVESGIPKADDPKAPGRNFSPLAPDSPLSGVADLPLYVPQNSSDNTLRKPLSKEKREQADRKQNWIFVSPDHKSFSPEKMLGVREEMRTGVADGKEFKGVMQSYLEKGVSGAADAEKRDNAGADASSGDGGEHASKSESIEADRSRGGSKVDGGLFGPGGPIIGDTSPSVTLFRNPGEYSGGSIYSDTARFGTLPAPGAKVERTESQKAWQSEFKQLLDSKPLGTEASGIFGRGGEGLFNDATRQPVNPVVGSGLGSLPGGGLSRSPFDGAPRSPGFDSASRPNSFMDSAPKVFGNSSLAPTLYAPPAPAAGMLPKPGVLEMPKRKF